MGKQKQKKGPSKKEPRRSHHDIPYTRGKDHESTWLAGYKVPKARDRYDD